MGLGPIITPDQVEAQIAGEYYFRGIDGACGAHINGTANTMVPQFTHAVELGLLTFCVLVLKNGFKVVGQSACASVDRYDLVVGRSVARDNAKEKIWELLGYMLKEKLAEAERRQALEGGGSFIERMSAEATDVEDRLFKLRTFMASNPEFALMATKPMALLVEQEQVMTHYLLVLNRRIAALNAAS